MNVINTQQRSEEWFAQRLGRITASRFKDVLTDPKTTKDREAGKLSQTAHTYMLQLLAEHLTGIPNSIGDNAAMRHGRYWEDDARQVYTEVTGREVRQVGFVICDSMPGVGCSPDGLVYEKGGIEIKCPYNSHEHLRNLTSGCVPSEYVAQIQGTIWVCQREWWDFVSYDPRQERPEMALCVIRVDRDEQFIGQLQRACQRLLDRLGEAIEAAAKRTPIESEVHRVVHLCVDPILYYNGEEIIP